MSAKRYKVGDTIVVRTDLNSRTRYGGVGINLDMVSLGGHGLTINRVRRNANGVDYYYVKENGWAWTDEMLELISPAPISRENSEEVQGSSDKSKDDLINLYKVGSKK